MQRLQKAQNQPIHTLFRFLQLKTRVQIWLYAQVHTRLEGTILGFDEYMNIVLDGAEEVEAPRKGRGEVRRSLGRILLKGDTVTAVTQAPVGGAAAAVSAAGGGAGADEPMQQIASS